MYRNAQLNFLDDVLSAVDVHVGAQIFEQAICGGKQREQNAATVGMGSSTRVLVTNQLHVLESCDRVVVLENGCIVEQGTPTALLESGGGASSRLAAMLSAAVGTDGYESPSAAKAQQQQDEQEGVKEETAKGDSDALATLEAPASTVQQQGKSAAADGVLGAERRQEGKVMYDVYWRWLRFGAMQLSMVSSMP